MSRIAQERPTGRAGTRLVVLIGACATIAACGGSGPSHRNPYAIAASRDVAIRRILPAGRAARPNIVFILTDDLTMNLLPFMPHVEALQRKGIEFKDYFVSDSLCCTSRASIFTGDFPHDTHVLHNFGADGGAGAFHRQGDEERSFAVALQRAGYRTALMGKYLNGYLHLPGRVTDGTPSHGSPTYVPPGWSQWAVAGWGYPEFHYVLNRNGVLRKYGQRRTAYLTDVIARLGVRFIDDCAAARHPFFLELATFAPHSPYVPAPRDAQKFRGLVAPRPPNFDRLPTHAPRWLAGHRPLTRAMLAEIDRTFRLRARSVRAIDRMLGQIEHTLETNHISQNTYVVFSSDNGLHTGEYRLLPGKQSAFDTDIHVPLIVAGPRVRAGSVTTAMTENVDLAKTFANIAGTTLAGDGHTLLPLLVGARPRNWRTAVLIEHAGPDVWGGDPDFQPFGAGNPRSYKAIRSTRFLYVEYSDGEREYYSLGRDPFELHNVASYLRPWRRRMLHAELSRMEDCHSGPQCWQAMHL